MPADRATFVAIPSMTPVPDSENPEHYATDADTSGGPRTAVPRNTPTEFRIDPAPYPTGAVVGMNLMCLAAAVGLHFFFRNEADAPQERWLWYAVPAGAALLGGGGFTAFVSWESWLDRRRGTWLVYEKETRRVRLPRYGEEFDLAEVVHLQDLVGPERGSGPLSEPWADLSVITCRNGERRRWLLMKYDGAGFDSILRPLAGATPIPVVRIRHKRFGCGVTIEPFPQ